MFRGFRTLCLGGLLFAHGALSSQDLPRHILALYDSNRSQTTTRNHVHANAEVILNHLGLIVDYWNIADGLPGEQSMVRYRGVLTWFYENEMPHPEAYLKWAKRQVANGKNFVVLGNIGAFKDSETGLFVPLKKINDLAEQIGFRVESGFTTENPHLVELVEKIPQMVEFERSLDHELSNYEKFRVTDTAATSYLKVRRKDMQDSESSLILTTPHGGFAASGYVLYENGENYNKQWRLNPFRFFEAAFALQGQPRPDVTTLNGMRIWCSHIDGDAFISRSQVRQDAVCAEIIRDEILRKYEWPTSVSVVVGEVQRDEKFENIARSIFKMDWVEAASHSHAHPFYWADDYPNKDKYRYRHLPLPGYKFDVKTEVVGSVNYINEKLLPTGKSVQNFFWTGNCEPTVEAIALCDQIGVNNINGGDTVFDKTYPSYTGVAPIGADVGGYRQIYAPNANENIYTNDWQGPFYGFKFVTSTFQNTESPVRLKPINVYYHFYSGEKWAALNALRKVMAETIVQDVAPIFVSQYTQVAAGFYTARFERLSENTWQAKNYGACRTVRFDQEDRFVDLEESSNVLGFNHYQGSLYVHLGTEKEATIALTSSKPQVTYLQRASHDVDRWSAAPDRISFRTQGFGKGDFTIANAARNHTFKIAMTGSTKATFNAASDADGTLRFLHPMRGPVAVTVTVLN